MKTFIFHGFNGVQGLCILYTIFVAIPLVQYFCAEQTERSSPYFCLAFARITRSPEQVLHLSLVQFHMWLTRGLSCTSVALTTQLSRSATVLSMRHIEI